MARAGNNHKGGNTEAGIGLIVDGQELARIFGVSRQYITTYRKAGMPVYDNAGPRSSPRYNTAACIRWKRDVDLAKAMPAESSDDDLSLEQIQKRTALVAMKKAEIELAVMEERYGDVELILKELSGSLATIRASLISLTKIAAQIEHQDSVAIEKRLDMEIRRILNELADFIVDAEDGDNVSDE